MKHGVIIAVVGIVIFIGFGAVVLANSTNCALGPAGTPEEEGNDTQMRKDDQSWFSHFVCISNMPQHNR